MKDLDLTRAQRISFQDRMPERVRKRDSAWKLNEELYEKGYLYASIDFGLLMTRPDKTDIVRHYIEVADNAGARVPLLFFSRPRNPIYVAFPAHLVEGLYPVIYIQAEGVSDLIGISVLETFLEEVQPRHG